MKNIIILISLALSFLSCNQEKTAVDLSARVNKSIDSIKQLSQDLIEESESNMAYYQNDSINTQISTITENIILEIINAYGKCPTDTILTVLKSLDNSGFIPHELYIKMQKEDWATEIGQNAKKDFDNYLKSNRKIDDSLALIPLLEDELLVYSLEEKDTISLAQLLAKHQGFKVLDFWSSWCAPCRSFNRKYRDKYSFFTDKNILIFGLGIRIDSEKEFKKFTTAVQTDQTPWPQFIDLNDNIYSKFNLNKVPFQILLNENNQIIKTLSFDIEEELVEISY